MSQSERSEQASVANELAALLYASPWPLIVSMGATVAVAAVLWYELASPFLMLLTSGILALYAARVWLWRAHRHGWAALAPEVWLRRFALGAALAGALWGGLGLAAALAQDPALDVFVPLVVLGLCASVASTYAAHLPAVDGFIWPAILPLALGAALQGGPLHWVEAALYLVFVANLSLMVRRSHRAVVHTIESKIEKERLAAGLWIARNEAEAASEAKSQFLANMSHELRTPLNAILGFSEIIGGEMMGPVGNRRYVEYAADLHRSGEHLLRLINDLLDLAKIDAGRLGLAESVVEVAPLLEASLRMVAQRAEGQGLSLSCEVAPGIHAVRGDETRLKQIVLNLLSNSIKFTPRGGTVAIRAWLDPAGLMIEVADTGVGIAEADLATALEPFGQVGEQAAAREGTGLGLPLSKRLAELHGGTLAIASAMGEGTRVRVTLPVQRVVHRAA